MRLSLLPPLSADSHARTVKMLVEQPLVSDSDSTSRHALLHNVIQCSSTASCALLDFAHNTLQDTWQADAGDLRGAECAEEEQGGTDRPRRAARAPRATSRCQHETAASIPRPNPGRYSLEHILKSQIFYRKSPCRDLLRMYAGRDDVAAHPVITRLLRLHARHPHTTAPLPLRNNDNL